GFIAAGQQPCHSGNIAVFFSGTIGITQQYFVDDACFDTGVVQDCFDGGGGHIIWSKRAERPTVSSNRGTFTRDQKCFYYHVAPCLPDMCVEGLVVEKFAAEFWFALFLECDKSFGVVGRGA